MPLLHGETFEDHPHFLCFVSPITTQSNAEPSQAAISQVKTNRSTVTGFRHVAAETVAC